MIRISGSVLWAMTNWFMQKEPEGILTKMRKKSDAIIRKEEAEET